MSARPHRLLAVCLLLFWLSCFHVTDARRRKKTPTLLFSNKTDSGSQKYNGGSQTSGTRLTINGLDEKDVDKLLPYEALENTDVRERQFLSSETISKYYSPRNKTRNNFTLFDDLSAKPSRNKRQTGVSLSKTQSAGKHVPKLLHFYKEVKINFTNNKQELSKRFRDNINTFALPGKSGGKDIWTALFSGTKKSALVGKEFPVLQAAPPSRGFPWPFPQSFTTNPDHIFTIDDSQFQFILSKNSHNCDLIQAAFTRHSRQLNDYHLSHIGLHVDPVVGNKNRLQFFHHRRSLGAVQNLEVTIDTPCDHYPSLESDESYHLDVNNTTAVLRASQVWGALRGLQSFTQMVYVCNQTQLCINQTSVEDFPRFRHRGLMLDTARHFISPAVLKTNMDAMEMNKLNVLHWHIVDDQSFPFESREFPALSAKGAYSPREIYSHDVVQELIEYGRLRGIRLVPELDTPGHVQSWGAGHPELLTNCGPGGKGPMDPSKNTTFELLSLLFSEVMDLFPDKLLHLGGDECSFDCWRDNLNIREFMQENGLGDDLNGLEDYYINRLLASVSALRENKEFVFWQDILDNNVHLPANSVVQVWKGWGAADIRSLQRATDLGLRTIYSAPWYLNYISYGKDWVKYYMADPTDYVWTDKAKQLIIGGEACLWGEFIDDTNLLQTLWPRASAVAERLWSGRHVNDPSEAEPRFEEHRCRMIRADVPASPNSGPGSCHRPSP